MLISELFTVLKYDSAFLVILPLRAPTRGLFLALHTTQNQGVTILSLLGSFVSDKNSAYSLSTEIKERFLLRAVEFFLSSYLQRSSIYSSYQTGK